MYNKNCYLQSLWSKNHMLFMTEIPCTDNFVQKSFSGERLPAERDHRLPDFACTEPLTLLDLCKLGTTFCANFELQRYKISVYTAASPLRLFRKWLPLRIPGEKSVEFAWACLSDPRFTDLLFRTVFRCTKGGS